MSRALGDVRAALDRVAGLPEEAEEPQVTEVLSTFPVITVSLSGDIPEQELREVAKDLRDQLRRVDGVASVSIFGIRESRILIEIEPERLDQYRLSLEEIRAAVANQNRNVPGGALKTARGEILVRTLGVAGGVGDVERMILRATGRTRPYGGGRGRGERVLRGRDGPGAFRRKAVDQPRGHQGAERRYHQRRGTRP